MLSREKPQLRVLDFFLEERLMAKNTEETRFLRVSLAE